MRLFTIFGGGDYAASFSMFVFFGFDSICIFLEEVKITVFLFYTLKNYLLVWRIWGIIIVVYCKSLLR